MEQMPQNPLEIISLLGPWVPILIIGFILLVIWSLIWKFIALWKCGRNNQLVGISHC
jgi:hypothetical protein